MMFLTDEKLAALREEFTPGTRVELVRMDDPYNTALVPGSTGTVRFVDDAGGIHVRWDCGSGLAVVYGCDECRVMERGGTDDKP